MTRPDCLSYDPDGCDIALSLDFVDGIISLSVSDKGVGLSEEKLVNWHVDIFKILIDWDESHGSSLIHEQSAKSNGVCPATAANTVTKYMSGGIESVTEYKRNINSDNVGRKPDGQA